MWCLSQPAPRLESETSLWQAATRSRRKGLPAWKESTVYSPLWEYNLLLISVLACPLWPPMTAEERADRAEPDSAALVKSAAS